jgi:hypothetical protein
MYMFVYIEAVMVIQLPMKSVLITTNIVSSNPADIEVYSIQHYVIKIVSDLDRYVVNFIGVLWFPPPIKLIATI